jgi:predicted DNA-binding transcriptional regulator YafY
MYRSLAPDNLDFDGTSKLYLPSAKFQPLFPHSPGRVLVALSEGFGDGVHSAGRPLVPCEFPNALSLPSASVLAPITRAINRRKAVRIKYRSRSSGLSEREVVPLALVNIGTRWHARVFDRKSEDFRDFVLTRMLEPQVLEDSPVRDEETAQSDLQWSRIIELELVPHPDFESRDVVLMDYPMEDGLLKVRVRAANAGYMLQQWHVDCSPDHSQRGREFALWLRDPLALYGSESAFLAPGYRDPKSK